MKQETSLEKEILSEVEVLLKFYPLGTAKLLADQKSKIREKVNQRIRGIAVGIQNYTENLDCDEEEYDKQQLLRNIEYGGRLITELKNLLKEFEELR